MSLTALKEEDREVEPSHQEIKQLEFWKDKAVRVRPPPGHLR